MGGFWEEEAYTRKDANGNLVSLEEYEARQKKTWFMTKGDLKLYAICGVGFFIDAYDLFIINLATQAWIYEYWGGNSKNYPTLLKGAVNASANIGNIVGQISFGVLGDAFGRKFVYGKELIIAMVGIILTISLPNHRFGSVDKAWWLFGFRLLMGIGIGGDYPMSAAIVAERSTLNNRGRMLGWIFSNQGWGTFAASLVSLILYGIYHDPLSAGYLGQLDSVWRLMIGLILVPCSVTLYWRFTMPESSKFTQSQELSAVQNSSLMNSAMTVDSVEKDAAIKTDQELSTLPEHERRVSIIEAHAVQPTKADNFKVFLQYFSRPKNALALFGTASSWFLVDVAFYGLNLNSAQLLSDIGYAKGATPYETLLRQTYGNLIVVVAGYLPGYFFTIAFIELIGRKPIQIGGFVLSAIFFAIIAGAFDAIGVSGRFACFVFAQFFFNFGPNATTFIVPAELFPSRVRGFAHGISAATGKCGAILSGLLFNYLSDSTRLGTAKVLWIFFAFNMAGAFASLLVPETKGFDADAADYEETQAMVAAKGI